MPLANGITILSPAPSAIVYVEDSALSVHATLGGVQSLSRVSIRAMGRELWAGTPTADLVQTVDLDPLYPADQLTPLSLQLEIQTTDRGGRMESKTQSIFLQTRFLWRAPANGAVRGVAALPAGGVVYTTENGWLHVAGPDGHSVCAAQLEPNSGFTTGPALALNGERVVVAGGLGLRAARTDNCMETWVVGATESWSSQPVSTMTSDGRAVVYATTTRGVLHSIDVADGSIRWMVDLATVIPAGGAISADSGTAIGPDGAIYQAANQGDGALRAGHLMRFTPEGMPVWRLPGLPFEGGILASATEIVLGARGKVSAVRPATGDVIWESNIAAASGTGDACSSSMGGIGCPAVRCTPGRLPDGNVAMCDSNGFIYSLLGATGAVVWDYQTGVTNITGLGGVGRGGVTVDAMGRIYVGDRTSVLHALSPAGDVLWQTRVSDPTCVQSDTETCLVEITSPPAIVDEVIYFGTRETQEVLAYATR